jgi:hypothetical protein
MAFRSGDSDSNANQRLASYIGTVRKLLSETGPGKKSFEAHAEQSLQVHDSM